LETVREKIIAKNAKKKRKDRPGLADDTLQGGEEEGGEQRRDQHPQVAGGGAVPVLILKERIEKKQRENSSVFIQNINKYKLERRTKDWEVEEGRRHPAGSVVEGYLGIS
jgi:hypothetical protein